jgi:hypothetical protein
VLHDARLHYIFEPGSLTDTGPCWCS